MDDYLNEAGAVAHRGARYIDPNHEFIDVEIDHPTHGWIPITINEVGYGPLWQEIVSSDPAAYTPPSYEEQAFMVRQQRDYLLRTEVDPIVTNVLRWGALTDAAKAAWATYRTALLDISAQSGFPYSVVWPTKPEGD